MSFCFQATWAREEVLPTMPPGRQHATSCLDGDVAQRMQGTSVGPASPSPPLLSEKAGFAGLSVNDAISEIMSKWYLPSSEGAIGCQVTFFFFFF